VNSSGDISLDISFSDHRLSIQTLEAFGKVIQSIRQVCDDGNLRFWSFIRYVSLHHSDLLGVEMSEANTKRCDEILARANPKSVTVELVQSIYDRCGIQEAPEQD
jgi:hypothetical protein